MKIGINALSAQAGGGINDFENLLPSIKKIDKQNNYIIFIKKTQNEIIKIIPTDIKKVEINYLPSNPYLRAPVRHIWEQFIFPFYIMIYKIDVLYSIGNVTSILAPCRIVLYITNANPYSLKYVKWPLKFKIINIVLKWLGLLSAKRADKVRFPSKNTMNLLSDHLNLPPNKGVVIYNGLNDNFKNALLDKNFESIHQNRYVLSVGLLYIHKNYHRLLEAFKILVDKYHYNGDLLIIGNYFDDNYFKYLNNLVKSLSLQERVFFKGKVLNMDLIGYYKFADVFVIPSISESFGIPLIEAMTIGTPIVASDCEMEDKYRGICFNPFREICGNAASYCNPFDPQDITESIYKVISDTTYRNQLVSNGKLRSKQFSVIDTARGICGLLENFAGKHH